MGGIGNDVGAADSAADDRNILDHERFSPLRSGRKLSGAGVVKSGSCA